MVFNTSVIELDVGLENFGKTWGSECTMAKSPLRINHGDASEVFQAVVIYTAYEDSAGHLL